MTQNHAILAYALGPIIITVGTVLVGWWTYKGSQRAARVTTKTEEATSAVDGYHKLVQDLQTDVQRLRDDHDELRKQHEELGRHVRVLEDKARRDKSLIQALMAYVRVLITEIKRMGGNVPAAPLPVVEQLAEVSQ